jgi:hypothetical protein
MFSPLHVVDIHEKPFSPEHTAADCPPKPGQARGFAQKLFPTIGEQTSIIVNPFNSIARPQLRKHFASNRNLLLPGKVRPDHFKPLFF